MGSSAPKVTAVPQPETSIYQTVIPQRDFDTVSNYADMLNKRTYGTNYTDYFKDPANSVKAQIEQMVGTPQEIGARNAGYRAREAASYAASIPARDKFVQGTPAFDALSETSNKISNDMRENYAQAVQKVEESKSNPAPAWTPPPEPAPQTAPDPWREPERQPEPKQELKDVPWTNITQKGQSYSSPGNGETFSAMLRLAKETGRSLTDVSEDPDSWRAMGYKNPGQKYRLPI